VTIIDAGAMTYTNVPAVEKGETLSLHGVALHVLGAGQKFDLANRRPVMPDDSNGKGGGPKAKRRESDGGAKKPAKKGKAR
jgi:cyanophycinase-like exopeptidase